jgi:hypothetical protein
MDSPPIMPLGHLEPPTRGRQAGQGRRHGKKALFFFEKKNQKTFIRFLAPKDG